MKAKSIIILSLFILFSFIEVKAQEDALNDKSTIEDYRAVYPKAGHFYKSSEDYYNDKPVENIDYLPNSWSSGVGGTRIKVDRNGKVARERVSDLTEYWISTEYGMLMRCYEKDFYIVVINGPFCYYVKFLSGEAYFTTDGKIHLSTNFEGKFFAFYSLTLTGEIKKMDEKFLIKYLDKLGLGTQYKNDKIKREMKDTVAGYFFKKVMKNIQYIYLANEESAKQEK
jgi:hypothetical protein